MANLEKSASNSPEMQAIVRRGLNSMRGQLLQQTPFLNAGTLTGALAEVEHILNKFLEQQRCPTEKSQARFDFFRLPAEIRNRIYELVIPSENDGLFFDPLNNGNNDHVCIQNLELEMTETDTYYYGNRVVGEYEPSALRLKDAMPPPIARVCQRIRKETLPMFYGQKTFVAYVDIRAIPDFDLDTTAGLRNWLQRVGRDQIPLIKHFCIKMPLAPLCTVPGRCSRIECSVWKPNGVADVVAKLGLWVYGIPTSAISAEVGATVYGASWQNPVITDHERMFKLDWTPIP